MVAPHTATDSPPTKRKKGVAEKAGKVPPAPTNFPGEIMGGAKKSLSSFKIPKRNKVETKVTPTPASAAVKIPALDIREEKGAVGDSKVDDEAVGRKEDHKTEEKAKFGTPTPAEGTEGKRLSDLRLEAATTNLRAILAGSDQNSTGQAAPALIQDLLSIAQNLPSKSSAQNLPSKQSLPPKSVAPSVPSKSIAPSLPSKSPAAPTLTTTHSVAVQAKKAAVPSQAQSQVPAVVSTVPSTQGQAAAVKPTIAPPKEPKPAPAKGGSRAIKPKKAKEPPKPTSQGAAGTNYIALLQTLEPALLQSLAANIQQSLKVVSVCH